MIFIEVEIWDLKNLKVIKKRLNSAGIVIDYSFVPKMLSVAESTKKVFLLKVKANNKSRKKILQYPAVINYWELKSIIPFNENKFHQ